MISSQITKNSYETDGTTRRWAYTFPIVASSDIEVWLTAEGGNPVKIETNYTVDTDTNEVVYPSDESLLAAIAVGSTVTLKRARPMVQGTSYTTQGTVSKTSLETAFDDVVMMVQDLSEKVDRAIKFPITETPSEVTLQFAATLSEHFGEGPLSSRPSAPSTWFIYYAWDDNGGQTYLYSPAKGWATL